MKCLKLINRFKRNARQSWSETCDSHGNQMKSFLCVCISGSWMGGNQKPNRLSLKSEENQVWIDLDFNIQHDVLKLTEWFISFLASLRLWLSQNKERERFLDWEKQFSIKPSPWNSTPFWLDCLFVFWCLRDYGKTNVPFIFANIISLLIPFC